MGKVALVTGATGMIGGLILEHCLASSAVSRVISLVRKPTGVEHGKLQEVVIDDFLNLDTDAEYFESIDVVYYCLGVYTGVVGRDLFRTITVAYPETLAKVLINRNPNLSFCLLSGAGADRSEKSRMMFAKDKGIAENLLSAIGFKSFHAFRPGYIYPVTKRQEPNFSYRLMRGLYPVIKLFGENSSIKSTDLAKSMFFVGLHGHSQEVFENKDIINIARQGSL